MLSFWAWLLAYISPLVGFAIGSFARLSASRLRRAAVLCAAASLAAAGVALVHPELSSVELLLSWPLAGEPERELLIFRLDTFSRVLVLLAPGLWLLTLSVTPRGLLDTATLRRMALATAITSLTFLCVNIIALAIGWLASTAIYLVALSGAPRQVTRVAWVYLGGASVLFCVGVGLFLLGGAMIEPGIWLIAFAALIRKGVFPFHAWLPEMFERGRLGPSILFSAPQLGSYICMLLVVPYGSDLLLRVLAILGLYTAVHASALALVQTDARRALGYLFVGQSALVVAGLDCTSAEALSGALILWVSSAVAFAGLARVVLVLEARRGRLKLNVLNGGHEHSPVLAGVFLVLGLACTGFPGTLGFIGEELLVAGATSTFPVLGFCVVLCSAFTGLAVVRMYFSLFCGPSKPSVGLGLRAREVLGFGLAVVFLVGMGVLPRAFVDSRAEASDALIERREQVQAGAAHPLKAP